MADDEYANVPSESSMGNYRSREWGFFKVSDCWRESEESSAWVRVCVSQFVKANGFDIVAMGCLPKLFFLTLHKITLLYSDITPFVYFKNCFVLKNSVLFV